MKVEKELQRRREDEPSEEVYIRTCEKVLQENEISALDEHPGDNKTNNILK